MTTKQEKIRNNKKNQEPFFKAGWENVIGGKEF